MGAILDILLKRPIMGPILKMFFKPAEVPRKVYTKEQRRAHFSGLYGPAAVGKKNWPSKHNRNKRRIKRAIWRETVKGFTWKLHKTIGMLLPDPTYGDISSMPNLYLGPVATDVRHQLPDFSPGKAPGT